MWTRETSFPLQSTIFERRTKLGTINRYFRQSKTLTRWAIMHFCCVSRVKQVCDVVVFFLFVHRNRWTQEIRARLWFWHLLWLNWRRTFFSISISIETTRPGDSVAYTFSPFCRANNWWSSFPRLIIAPQNTKCDVIRFCYHLFRHFVWINTNHLRHYWSIVHCMNLTQCKRRND